MKATPPLTSSGVALFRLKMLATMMLVVGGMTVGGLFYVKHNREAADQTRLRNEFQSELGRLLGSQEARREAIAERCQMLAQSPRILAALEEGELADLYLNTEVELRNVLENEWDQYDDGLPKLLRARGFRFLNASGAVMPMPGKGKEASSGPLEAQLVMAKIPEKQEIGYVVLNGEGGADTINEVIVTPIVNRARGETRGAIALYFAPVDLRAQSSEAGLKVGVLVHDHLYMSTQGEGDEAFAQSDVTEVIGADEDGSGAVMTVAGKPFMAFSNVINPESSFPEARQVCFYPIADSLAQRREQQKKVVALGGLALLCGLGVSYLLSQRLSRPVQRLAENSAENQMQRERAEAALEVTERKYQSIFENAIEGIFILSEEGRFISVNPALAEICGYASQEEMIRALDGDGMQLYGGCERFEIFAGKLREAGSIFGFEREMVRANGRRIWVSQNVRYVPEEDGIPCHFEGSVVDITERKRAADEMRTLNAGLETTLHELKNTQQQVIQQERMRALGEMASGVAHDFNNALTPILGYTDLMISQSGDMPPNEALQHLNTIRIAAADAAQVVTRLREFYRKTSEGEEEYYLLNVNEVVQQTVVLTQPRWRQQSQSNGITIEVVPELEEPLPEVSGNPAALREMLTNLVFNAVDAMPSGGTIFIRTQRRDGSVVLKISDEGTGMTEEVRRHCLEPFFSTKGEGGTGLGLSMVRGIVERHGGEIDIESKLGIGTTFVISLPVAVEAQNETSVMPENEVSDDRPSLRLLVVDDEQPIRVLLAAVLERDGHHVVMAPEGNEALRLFQEQHFDLVITDKAMPQMNGDQLARAVKKFAPDTPVILLTGFGEFLDCSDLPEVDVLASKPFSIESLREAISVATRKAA